MNIVALSQPFLACAKHVWDATFFRGCFTGWILTLPAYMCSNPLPLCLALPQASEEWAVLLPYQAGPLQVMMVLQDSIVISEVCRLRLLVLFERASHAMCPCCTL